MTNTHTRNEVGESRAAVIGAFDSEHAFVEALQQIRQFDARLKLQTWSPHPVDEVDELVLDGRASPVPKWIALAAAIGAVAGFALQSIGMALHYPPQVAGRPSFSWPAFLPITFELAILFGALTGFFSYLALVKLPRLHQPALRSRLVSRASIDRFVIEVHDPTGIAGGSENWECRLRELGASETEILTS